jgi:hypothetical protein
MKSTGLKLCVDLHELPPVCFMHVPVSCTPSDCSATFPSVKHAVQHLPCPCWVMLLGAAVLLYPHIRSWCHVCLHL